MGHDIVGYDGTGEEIARARFSMGNGYAFILYNILDAQEYNAGVSGSGDSSVYSTQQMELVVNAYQKVFDEQDFANLSEGDKWDQKQILDFIKNCLASAQSEGSVRVTFS